jgi:purine-binding chemotaxis protein CheW
MADSPTVRLVIFRVGELGCALPVEMVREIVPTQPATRIPGAPAAVEGLVNVRGTLLTVIDGALVLGQNSTEAAERSVLVLEADGHTFGFTVDEVLDLQDVHRDELTQRESLPGVDPRFTLALGRLAGRIFVMLDPAALLAPLVGG